MCNNWDKYLLSLSGSDSWTALKILSSVQSSQFGGKWSIRAALSCLFISPPRRLLSHFLSTNQQLCYHTQSLDHSHGRLVDQWYALCWTWITGNNVFLCNKLTYARLPSTQKGVSHLYTSHSQMLGKFEYTLPAKFWRLVGCTEMLSW